MSVVDMSADLAAAYDLLVREGELLDDRRLQDWLALYTDDCVYHVPQGTGDEIHHVQIAYDDKRRLSERVLRLESGFAYSQEPRSITVHVIGSVRLDGETEAGDLVVRSSQLIAEVRRGIQSDYAARVTHHLARTPDGLRIRRKVIRLANADVPLGNLTFLL